MEKLKNLCGQIPEELHNKVRTEQESLGLTLGKYLEQVLTAHFAAPAPAVRGGDRTLAFQVPEVLFQRVKQYLEAHKPLSQKAFVVGLLENALIKWERGEEISSGMNTIGKGEKERTLAVVVPWSWKQTYPRFRISCAGTGRSWKAQNKWKGMNVNG